MTEATKHALLSPSGAAGWLACTGKIAMEDGLPDGSNEHSDYGTAAHTIAAEVLQRRFNLEGMSSESAGVDPAWWLGHRVDVSPHKTVEVDQVMVDGVRCYVDMVANRVEAYKLAGASSIELLVEQRVPIGHITGEEGARGTADVVLLVSWPDAPALIEVIDLKFGVGIKVFAEKNPQAMMYALGAVENFGVVTDFGRVRITIHQPRVSEEPSEWEIDIGELMLFGAHCKRRAKDVMTAYDFRTNWLDGRDGFIYLTAGEHCRKTFCKARATCPKLAAFVEEEVGADFDDLTDETKITGQVIVGTVANTLLNAPEDIARKFKAIGIIEDWCKAVRARAEALLFEHNNSPEIIEQLGIKLVQGKQGDRAWSDADEAEKVMKSMRLKQEQMYDFKLISPTAAEKLAPKFDKNGKLKPDQAETVIKPKQWPRLEALITRAPGRPSVAPITDKRPPLELTTSVDEFDEVPPEDGSDLV